MSLTDRAIINLKPTGKSSKHFDGGGLHIFLSPTGGKLWRLVYRFEGREKLLSIGPYPAVSLKMAREKRDEAKELLVRGIDPGEMKKEMKKISAKNAANSFEAVAREWHTKQKTKTNPNKAKGNWTDRHAAQVIARLEKNVFPFIGKYPITSIKAADILNVLQRIEARQTYELAHQIMQICGQVCRYAVATGRAERNVVLDLQGALTPHKSEHHATIPAPQEIGGLLRAIDEYNGDFITACALKMAPLVFVRPGELRGAEWAEFDLEQAEFSNRLLHRLHDNVAVGVNANVPGYPQRLADYLLGGQIRMAHKRTGGGGRVAGTRSDGHDIVIGFDDVAAAAKEKNALPVDNDHGAFKTAQRPVRAPFLGHFNGGAGDVAVVLRQLLFKSFEKREGVGGRTGKADLDLSVGE